MKNKINLLSYIFFLFPFTASAQLEHVIYVDQNNNVLSERIRSTDEVTYNGFEDSCSILINPTSCFGYGGGGWIPVYSCTNIDSDRIMVAQNSQSTAEVRYKSKITYKCFGNFITEITLKESSCGFLPGDVFRPALNEQFHTEKYLCK